MFKNLVVWGVLIRRILEVGFSCFCERIFSFVPVHGDPQWPFWDPLSPKVRGGLGALASGRRTWNSDMRGLLCWSECPPSLVDLIRLRRSLQHLSLGCQLPLLSAKKTSVRYCATWATVGSVFVHLGSSDPLTGFPGGSDGKESACNAGDLGLIPGSGRSPGEGNGYPLLQYSYLKNPMDRGGWQATVHGGHKESDMNEWLIYNPAYAEFQYSLIFTYTHTLVFWS